MKLPAHITKEWLLARTEKRGVCTEWIKARCRDGYGSFGVRIREKNQIHSAHRAMWYLANGDPGKLHVLHRCDNPPCLNIDHLFLGTHQDNVADRVAKGREANHAGGENGRAILGEQEVLQIRSMWKYLRISQRSLGKMFLVNHRSISAAVNKKTWKHI